MTNKKSTKKALLMSALSLFVCVSMLIGSTFAWFTDSVTSGGNIIKSGKLDVEMYWAEGTEPVDSADWKDASEGAIFDYDKWEPGYVVVRHIKIANEGTLALKYQLKVIANGTVSELADVIDVYYVEPAEQVTERSFLTAGNKLGTLNEVLANVSNSASGNLTAGENHTVTLALKMKESAGNDYQNKSIGTNFSVQLLATQLTYEEDSFGNDYDADATYPASTSKTRKGGQSIEAGNISVKLPSDAEEGLYHLYVDSVMENLTDDGQTTFSMNISLFKDGEKVESGVDYEVTVGVGKGLNITSVTHNGEAIENFTYLPYGFVKFTTDSFSPFAIIYNDGTVTSDTVELITMGGVYSLTEDASTDSTLVIPEGTTVTLDLQGQTLSADLHKNTGPVIKNNGTLILTNGTISSTAANGGSAIVNNGTLTVSDMTLNGAPNADESWPSYTVNNSGVATFTNTTITSYHGAVASYGEGAMVTLSESVIDMAGIPGFTSHGIYTYNGGAAVVDGGTYKNNATDQNSTGGSVLNGNITVLDGNFSGRIENYYGTPVLKGGNYTVRPSASFIATDYEAVQDDDGSYSVVPLPVAKIGDTEYRYFSEAVENWTANSTLTLLRDATMTETAVLKSTEHHILDLSTYTLTSAEGKNAIEIKSNGTGDAERNALTINADTENPGGINAGKKSVIYYKYSGISSNDRPIIKINGGVFTGSTTNGIYMYGSAARKCATLQVNGGTFNCAIYGQSKSKMIITGGIFNYSVASQGDSTCYRLISGGSFQSFGWMTADASSKFTIGTAIGKFDVGVYVDENNYLVVGGPVITEAGDKFVDPASAYNAWSGKGFSGNNCMKNSSAYTYGLYYVK